MAFLIYKGSFFTLFSYDIMTNENTNFDEMTAGALEYIDETLDKNMQEQEPSNPYTLTQGLLQEGFMFDSDGVYVPFKETFQLEGVDDDGARFKTRDDIYLFISRNPDKKLELNFKWATKTADGFNKARGFNIDFLLDIGDEKDSKTLNRKVSFAGGKNGNPASDGTYVAFVEYFTDKISEADCLEVFKEPAFEFPPISEETSEDVEIDDIPQCFNDYPEKVQHEAMNILNNGSLFDEMTKSVSLTHEGHKTTRNALVLMESSVFVDDGAHGLLGGESGGGKTDLALTCALNLPAKNVHVISSNSPKDIFYDFESYDDDFNILIFDDILFNDELIKLCKLLTDNRVKDKVHKTVINGKAEQFKLKGKYEIIITYAKTLPDEELANRLFNIGVNIVDADESEGQIKHKILDNKITKGNDNMLVHEIRLPIQASVQYLLEHMTLVFNPYLSMYNPLNFNNRDINHLVSMTNARTFFDLNKRAQIKINDDTVLTIGSLEDLSFVNDIWARDEEAQKYKLSELQKRCLDILPELTDKEAFDYVEELNKDLDKADSREYKKKLLDEEPLLKSLAKKLNVNPSTLKHALDRFNEGNQKSLCEIGLVEKIRLDEENSRSPNFYYKVKLDDMSFNSSKNDVQDMQITFAHSFNSSFAKQKIIIDLLIYAHIIVNERGVYALQKYCNDEDVELTANNYDNMIEFLQGFFDRLNFDEHVIKFEDASRDDMLKMFSYKDKLVENLKKTNTPLTPADETKICTTKTSNENAQDTQQSNVECANNTLHKNFTFKTQIKEFLEEKHIDMCIAQQTFNCLWSNGAQTQQDITNYICETVDPDDLNNETTPLKIETHVNRMYMHDLLEFTGNRYELTPDFVDMVTSQGGEIC